MAFCSCTSLATITIPNSVTYIGSEAFRGCTQLESISIPDGVTTIDSAAFYYCTNLESVIISDSVTSIGKGALYGCSSLKKIYYLGTEEQWGKITVGSTNSVLTDTAKYYYSETAPGANGKYWHYVNGVPTVWSK